MMINITITWVKVGQAAGRTVADKRANTLRPTTAPESTLVCVYTEGMSS